MVKLNSWPVLGVLLKSSDFVWGQGRWGDENDEDIEVELADEFEEGD